MVEPLRHRQTKGAATDMFYLTPPRNISTLPKAIILKVGNDFRSYPNNGHVATASACPFRATNGLVRRSGLPASRAAFSRAYIRPHSRVSAE